MRSFARSSSIRRAFSRMVEASIASVCKQLAVSGGEIGGRLPRIHVEKADGGLRGGRDASLFGRSAANMNQRQADHAAQFQRGDGHLRADALLLQRVEGHRKQIAPRMQGALDHGSRDTRRSSASKRLARRDRGPRQLPVRAPCASSRNPRSQPVTASAASTTAVSTSLVESEFCSARATSISDRSLARLLPSGFVRARGGGELIENPVDLACLDHEGKLVGIADPKLDAIRVAEHMARDLLRR